ncbi:MAG TPA: ATP-binding protein [Candidatus Saccharimonadales bacterium]|nr:ATP-binding protein [Candidatus Saccharimonadales bacterium]
MQRVDDGIAGNTVTLDPRGVVVISLHGKQSKQSVRTISAKTTEIVAQLHAEGKRARILTDLSHVTLGDVSSSASLEARRYRTASGDATAIVGHRGLASMSAYMQRLAGAKNVRYFTSEREARDWLDGHTAKPKKTKSSASLVAGCIILAIAIMTLIGWYADNQYLMRWIPHLRPMNPMAAVGLLIGSVGFCSYWFGNLKALKITGIIGAGIGIAALLPLNIDTWLFASSVRMYGAHVQLADSAALCFIAWGLSPFTVEIKKSWLRRGLQYTIAATLLGLSLFNMVAQLYAHDFIYGISPSFVMAFNLAAAFTIAGCGMVLIVLYRKMGHGILGQVTRVGWLLVAALILVQGATYGAWVQAVDRNKADSSKAFSDKVDDIQASLQVRVDAYLATLQGFKGLFAASDYVDQGEFQSYYNSLNLEKNYPGLRTLSYISRISDKELPGFVRTHKTDTSLHKEGNPAFAITGKSNLPTHYIVTYVANTKALGGSDLGAQPSRLQAFQRAEAIDGPVSSGTLQFAATATAPAQTGFFLTVPVHNKNGTAITGFVNTVFNYDTFFANAFKGSTKLDGRSLGIIDTSDNSVIYQSKTQHYHGDNGLAHVLDIQAADHRWNAIFSAPLSYGIGGSQANLPKYILVGGQLFSVLLVAIFVILLRSRRQGYALAESITKDLQYERNTAVANDQKNTAILASIGDAVFAIDNNRRIQVFNPAAQHISGFTDAEAIGQRYDDILRFELEKTGNENRGFIAQALAGKITSMANHTVLIRKDGSRVPVADSAAPIRDAKGTVLGAIVVFRDVSKDYELDRAKTEFVSLASHQLRTPLSAINWYGELLLDGDAGKLNKTQHEYMVEIFEGNHRMIELVDSLLDVSRLEVGKLPSKPQDTSMGELVDSLEKELLTNIKSKKLDFTKSVAKLPPVLADPKQLRMIVQNLMSNAVKYTPPKGTVQVTLRKATESDIKAANLEGGDAHLFFSVKDSGYGIPQAQRPKIFGKLFRADNVRALDVEGTGLGLYIVKEVVEKMGGRVWFDSIESVGSTFYVVLPMKTRGGR